MKKVLYFLLLASFCHSCTTQQHGGWDFYFDYVGEAAAKAAIHGEGSYQDPYGNQFGIWTNVFTINDRSSFKSGLNFTYQGANWKEENLSGVVRLSYLNVPLLYSYEAKSKIYAEVGLQPGYLLSAKDKYNGESHDFKDQVKSFELGLPVEVGYRLSNKFRLGAMAIYGLTNLNNGNGTADHNLMVGGKISYMLPHNMKSK